MASKETTDCSTFIPLLPATLLSQVLSGQVVGTGLERENCSSVHTSSQDHPVCHPSRLTIKENVISCHFMDKKRGAGSEAVDGQASWSLRGNQSSRNRPLPIHLIQEWGRISSSGHGGAFNHGAGRGSRGQPLFLFPSFCLLLL